MYLGSLPPVSNREDWQAAFELVDAESGETIDIQLCSITMTVRDFKTKRTMFLGSTDAGDVIINADNTFQWSYPPSVMGGLCQGAYEIGLRISQGDRVAQLLISNVEVFEGIDTQ